MPLKWLLSPEYMTGHGQAQAQGGAATATREAALSLTPRLSPREALRLGLVPSSQRDAARGFATALAARFEASPPLEVLPSPRALWHTQMMERSSHAARN